MSRRIQSRLERGRRLAMETLEDRRMMAITASLLKDINVEPIFPASTNPWRIMNLNGVAYFNATTQQFGEELWKSDGTAAGTVMVKDICDGKTSSKIAYPSVAGGKLFFEADDGIHGLELWTSNGTDAGTHMVKDIDPGVFDGIVRNEPRHWNYQEMDGVLYFIAADNSHGKELWRTDGTDAGTYQVKDINPDSFSGDHPQNMTNVNSILYFTEFHGDNTSLWKTDGTESGTVKCFDFSSLQIPYGAGNFVNNNGQLFFGAFDKVHGGELWCTDGTLAGTHLVKDINTQPSLDPGTNGSSGPMLPFSFQGSLYFFADDGIHGISLWKTNGIESGTTLVSDYDSNSISTPLSAQEITVIDKQFFFQVPTNLGSDVLWVSDGTTAGTHAVQDVGNKIVRGSIEDIVNVNGELYFSANAAGIGVSMWKTDGTDAGTIMVWSSPSSTSPTYSMANVGGQLFFCDNERGHELWKTDGTQAGTTKLATIGETTDDSQPQDFTPVGNLLFFVAYTSNHGEELWKTDGTATNTQLVKDFRPGDSSQPDNLLNVNGTLFLIANTPGSGRCVGTSAGTTAGTKMITDSDGNLVDAKSLCQVGDNVFFASLNATNGYELWKSDGTPAGTHAVRDVVPGKKTDQILSMANVGGTLYFTAYDASKTPSATQLWKSDGTFNGTVMVKQFTTTDTKPEEMVNVNGIFHVTSQMSVARFTRFDAIGSGSEYALGAVQS